MERMLGAGAGLARGEQLPWFCAPVGLFGDDTAAGVYNEMGNGYMQILLVQAA